MTLTLDEAWQKLGRSREHFDALWTDIEKFWEANDYRITFDVDVEEAKYTFNVRNLKPPKPEWGLLVGDCVHNARAALDYLMVRLAAIASGKPPEDISGVQFPVADRPEKVASALGELRKDLGLSGYLTRIEELQPYNNGNPSIWGQRPIGERPLAGYLVADWGDAAEGRPAAAIAVSDVPVGLDLLTFFDNVDKHRAIPRLWHQVDHGELEGGVLLVETYEPLSPPPTYELNSSSRTIQPLEDGAEVGHMKFRPPIDGLWTPTPMEMKRYFPIRVALGEWRFTRHSALEILDLCLWSVEMVLQIFAPVFDSPRKPPLPVTVALP